MLNGRNAQFSVGIYIHSGDPSVMTSFATRLGGLQHEQLTHT